MTDWRHRALCRDEDPELFFPIGNKGPAELQIKQAKAVCWRCPVRRDCLVWALETGQDDGVLGGMSEDERRGLRRPVRSTCACGTRIFKPKIHNRCATCRKQASAALPARRSA